MINFPNKLVGLELPLTCEDAMLYGTFKLKKEVLVIYRKNNNNGDNEGEPIAK